MAKIRDDLSTGQRIYVETRYGEPVVDALSKAGCHWDAERKCWWVGRGKREAVEQLLRAEAASPATTTPQDPSTIRLTGKGVYKGRSYFLGAYTKDGSRVRCLTLPDKDGKYLDFWADVTAVEVTKTYQPREYRGRTEYTTLGSIAAFVAREQRNRQEGKPVCAACGASGDLVEDMEDGLMKHRRCADMPAE